MCRTEYALRIGNSICYESADRGLVEEMIGDTNDATLVARVVTEWVAVNQ